MPIARNTHEDDGSLSPWMNSPTESTESDDISSPILAKRDTTTTEVCPLSIGRGTMSLVRVL